DRRIERPAAVVHGRGAHEAHDARLDVDFDDARVSAEGPGHRLGMEEQTRVETGRALGGQRAAARRAGGERAQRNAAVGKSGDMRATISEDDVGRRALEYLAGGEAGSSRDLARRARDGGAGVGGHAARDRAVTEADQRGVATEHDDALERDAELARA